MLGLAVGLDYALFVLARHRDHLRDGEQDVVESVARATGTAGSAVVAAGATVVIALVGLFVTDIPFLTTMGLAAALGVAVAVALSLTAAFAMVNLSLVALAGAVGSAAGLLVAVVTAIVGITSTSPSTLASLARVLPTRHAGTVLRTVTMGGPGVAGATMALAVWALLAGVGMAWAIERQRTLPGRLLRPGRISGSTW